MVDANGLPPNRHPDDAPDDAASEDAAVAADLPETPAAARPDVNHPTTVPLVIEIIRLLREHGKFKQNDIDLSVDVSETAVHRTLAALEAEGWLRRTSGGDKIWRLGPAAAAALDITPEIVTQSTD